MTIETFTAQAKRINALATQMGHKVGDGITGAVMADLSLIIVKGLAAVAAGDAGTAQAMLVKAHNRAHTCLSGTGCADW